MKKRVLSLIMALAMVFSVLPATVFAMDSEEASVPAMPTATVTQLENEDLTFALNFKADVATEEQLAYYGDWYADYVLTVNKDVTFHAGGTADGYLSGQYDAWSENWVNVPFEDVTLKANEPLKIMEYAAELMGEAGLKLTYNDVYYFVKDFDCGVFFNDTFLSANPDLVVTLELRMYNPENESESCVIGETYTFGPEQPAATFTVSENLAVEGEASEEAVAAIIVDIQSNTALSDADYNPIEGVENVEELAVTLSGMEVTEDSVTKIVYTVEPKDVNGEKVAEPSSDITFRLPIPASVTEQYAKVYHDGELMGVYEIQGVGNAKYVEIESGSFSEFAVEPLSLTQVATKAELDAAIAAAEDGDTIQLTADIDYGTTQLAITRAITIDLSSKTLTTGNAYGGMSLKNGPTIKNGTIVHASNTAAIKVWNVASFENLTIDVRGKGDANKTIGGIVIQENAAGIGSLKNVTIKGDALTNGIETYNCGNATEPVIGSMENVNINAKGTGMLISAPCGTATNCSFKGDVSGIEIWIKGTYSATLDLVNCEVEGGEQAVFAHDEFSSNPSIVNNGTLELTVDDGTTFESNSNALLKLTIARAEDVDLDEVIENAIAKVVVDETTETYYATAAAANDAKQESEEVVVLKNLEEIWTKEDLIAFAEAVDNGDTFKGQTVKLMADIDLANKLFEPIGSYRNKTAFKGTFDGQGYTISNLSQNTWELNNGYYYGDLGLGLFGMVEDATIKNLTIDGAEISGESAICGTVAACAYGNCIFENITIKNANVADYQYYAGGIVGWASGNHQYINCDVEESTTIGSQWGDFNNANGGLIGGSSVSATIYLEDCDVACRLDAHNDVVSAYEWYTYRRTGMLIGDTGHTATDEAVTNAAAPNVTAVNCTVTYGDWAHYHYCKFSNMNYPWVRAEGGLSVDPYSNVRYGHPTDANGNEVVDHNHVHAEGDAHHQPIVLDQLFGGPTGDRYATYGEPAHKGVSVIIPAEARIGDTLYWTLAEAVEAAQEGDTIELLMDLCEICPPAKVENKNIRITADEGVVITAESMEELFNIADGSSVSMIGGTYAFDPAVYALDGYVPFDHQNGTWTVVRENDASISIDSYKAKNNRIYVALDRDTSFDVDFTITNRSSTQEYDVWWRLAEDGNKKVAEGKVEDIEVAWNDTHSGTLTVTIPAGTDVSNVTQLRLFLRKGNSGAGSANLSAPVENISGVLIPGYHVTLDNNGGLYEGKENNRVVFVDVTKSYGSISWPKTDGSQYSRVGYTFAGFAEDAENPDKIYSVNGLKQLKWKGSEVRTWYAVWTPNVYTVTFQAGEHGTFADGSKQHTVEAAYGSAFPAAPDLQSDKHFEAAGWTPSLPETVPVDGGTYTAVWTQVSTDPGTVVPKTAAYKVEHYLESPNGGYILQTEDTQFPLYAEIGKTVAAEGFVREYVGYHVNEDMSASVTVELPRSQDEELIVTTLQVHYDLNEYTITFDTDGGSDVAAITQDYGSAVTAPANPTKTGYTFAGWDKEIPAAMPAENVTITALWTVNQYTITFDTDGGSEIAAITQDYSTAVTAPADPTKTGYTFAGWDKEIPATMPAEDVTVTALWTVNQYTITFDTDGGSEIAAITQDYGTAVTAPADPTKTGYTFVGWDKEIPATMPAEDMTVKAAWKANVYQITYITYGGTVLEPVTEYTYGVGATLPTGVARAGYAFEGWYDNADCTGKKIKSISTADLGDKVFYAKWTRSGSAAVPEGPAAPVVTPEAPCSRGIDCPMYPYADLNTALWYHDGIHFTLESGLMNGTGADVFEPNASTSRAMIVTVLWRLEGKPVVNYAMSFKDVAAGTWYTEAVRWAASTGIVEGYNAEAFGPDDTITREQLATIMWRYAKYRGMDVSVGENTNILSYGDAFDVSEWAIPAMQWACGSGLIQGVDSDYTMNLVPAGSATRAQAATILYRFCSAAIK